MTDQNPVSQAVFDAAKAKKKKPELHTKIEQFYQGFQCGVRVNYDTCNSCKYFTVRSGWGEYCKQSEDFARLLVASLKSWGINVE